MCLIDGCDGRKFGSGLCSRHYFRLRRTGTTDDGPCARMPFEARIRKYIKEGRSDECWLWTGSQASGYGYIGRGKRGDGYTLAHRAAWEIANGRKIPAKMVIMHMCDTPLCCNPSHLRLGTHVDNMRDMREKGRARGIRAYRQPSSPPNQADDAGKVSKHLPRH